MGVFAGYRSRENLTEKAFVDIDGEIYYQTGDLVRLDKKGLLHYIGRKDHQIKLHGQRIEMGEIERCLLNITSISACVVMKWDYDHLVAYVQSSSVSEDELRSHCQSLLPPPHFLELTNLDQRDSLPLMPLEHDLCDIFTEAFHLHSPNVKMSFFQMGGSSLDAIQALSLIQRKISTKVDATLLFANPSIHQLAQAIGILVRTNDESNNFINNGE